jgi:membrane-bound lytic murein transglycosylase MltF
MNQRAVVLCRIGLALILAVALGASGCGKKQASSPSSESAQSPRPAPNSDAADSGIVPSEEVSEAASESSPGALQLPVVLQKRTGDLDEMLKARNIRALVLINPITFFYQNGHPHGITYEALDEFERFVNKQYKTGALKVKVTFIPMRPDQVEAALNEGVGDVLAHGVAITPAREQKFAFSVPIQTNVTRIIVTGSELAGAASFDELGNKAIYVNPLATYPADLNKINDERQKAGKPPLVVKMADKNLMEDDLIEMVNAGVIPATVTNKPRADLWAQVLPNVKPHPEMVVANGVNLGWVMRKNNPELKKVLDQFMADHAAGTSFGNTLLRRYLQNTKWIKNSSTAEEMKKFAAYVEYFKKYSAEYNFDYLMIAAQGYQESLLDQNRKSKAGAVGIMQVIPKYAAAKPINVPDVSTADKNIQAGVRMLRNIADTYFNDPGITQLNKTLFTFASYNAGPNRIARLRKKAAADGLDPNKWFGNVELEVAEDVGQETITYVSNIYKYYISYKLTQEQAQEKEKAKKAIGS